MPDSCKLNEEVDEVPPQVALKVEQLLEVAHSAPFSSVGLEVAEIVLSLRVDIADFLGGVNVHPLVLLKPPQRGVDGSGLVGLVLKSIFGGIFFLAMKNLGNFRHEEKRIVENY